MEKKINISDNIRWNIEAGEISGRIIKVNCYTRYAKKDDFQYEMNSSKTDHIAAHKKS